MIKAIFFDIGKVVVRTHYSKIYEGFGKRVGISPLYLSEYVDMHKSDFHLGAISFDQFLDKAIEAGADTSLDLRSIWIEEGVKWREENRELIEIIQKLRKKYIVVAFTNARSIRLPVDEATGIYNYFDFAFVSCIEHKKKPDLEFYQLGLDKVGVKPEEVIFIDDMEVNLDSAHAIGMHNILYTYPNNSELLENLKKFGVNI